MPEIELLTLMNPTPPADEAPAPTSKADPGTVRVYRAKRRDRLGAKGWRYHWRWRSESGARLDSMGVLRGVGDYRQLLEDVGDARLELPDGCPRSAFVAEVLDV